MKGVVRLLAGSVLFAAATVAVTPPAGGQARGTLPGDPLNGLTARQLEEFRLGQEDFVEVETSEDGLGPAFNGTSCAVCHSIPAIGGGGVMLETRAGYRNPDGSFRGLNDDGDTLIHLFSVPAHRCQPTIPDDVTVIARRAPIPLFGAGLVEAIPDETILALEDPDDRNRDGVSGRAAIIVDKATGERRVGRFGWKGQHATLLAFGADAYRNEMGITNDLFPDESFFGLDTTQLRYCDSMPEPEDVADRATGRRGIDNFESFMRFLAPLERLPLSIQAAAGQDVFSSIGCAACHVPALSTGPSVTPAFNRRTVPLFSDLLLHDIGTGDGIQQGAASGLEIRTPALWGLRFRRPLLHDGSAATIEDAIRGHAKEAEESARLFERLPVEDRAALSAFLRSL
jgi:CxxC motif-containing protein (DUF1111 family)